MNNDHDNNDRDPGDDQALALATMALLVLCGLFFLATVIAQIVMVVTC